MSSPSSRGMNTRSGIIAFSGIQDHRQRSSSREPPAILSDRHLRSYSDFASAREPFGLLAGLPAIRSAAIEGVNLPQKAKRHASSDLNVVARVLICNREEHPAQTFNARTGPDFRMCATTQNELRVLSWLCA